MGRRIYMTTDQVRFLQEMDVHLTSDGTVSDAQNVLNQNQQQLNQAKAMDGKKPNATITTPNSDNTKPTAYIQSSPGESASQALANNKETVQKAFDNNGSVTVEVNEGLSKRDIEKLRLENKKEQCINIVKNGKLLSKHDIKQQINALKEAFDAEAQIDKRG